MISKQVFKRIGALAKDRPFEVVFLDGSVFRNADSPPLFRLAYKSRKGYLYTLLFQGYGLAESYIKGYLDIEGDIRQLVLMQGKIDMLPETPSLFKSSYLKLMDLNRIRNYWHEFRSSNRSRTQAKKNAKFHYNRGTEMFREYLDESMTYTCAYWKPGTKDLAQAQRDKIDHTLKKLRLRRGETLVDVGSGWGSVLFRAYESYGAIGTNVSPTPDQNEAMQKEIEARGLAGKVKIKELDFVGSPGTELEFAL